MRYYTFIQYIYYTDIKEVISSSTFIIIVFTTISIIKHFTTFKMNKFEKTLLRCLTFGLGKFALFFFIIPVYVSSEVLGLVVQ